jgi:inorganic pyrophosphatase
MTRLERVLFFTPISCGRLWNVPQTLLEEGYALDVLVLVTNPPYLGILIEDIDLSAC